MAMDRAAEASPWAPLAQRTFRWLWVGVLFSYVGTWMQTVGAQWFLVETAGAGGLVALVQTAATLPVMLLVLPAGVIADVFDRRWVLIAVQVYVLVVAGSLALLTLSGLGNAGADAGVHLRSGRRRRRPAAGLASCVTGARSA